MRDSYEKIVHGEIPEGFSPRKLTVRPWKASNFPALKTLFLITETYYLVKLIKFQHGNLKAYINKKGIKRKKLYTCG